MFHNILNWVFIKRMDVRSRGIQEETDKEGTELRYCSLETGKGKAFARRDSNLGKKAATIWKNPHTRNGAAQK